MINIIAIITARGGSKGVLRKNVRDLNGKPLIAYTIEAAKKCKWINSVVVTTEDEEIKAVSRMYGAVIVDRPNELATDHALSRDVVIHALEVIEKKALPEYFVLMQPTSPLRTSDHLDEFISKFLTSGSASGISVVQCEHHPYKVLVDQEGIFQPIKGWNFMEQPRQVMPKAYRPNGAMYILSPKDFRMFERFYVEPVYLFPMETEVSIDIDSELDLLIAQQILKRANKY
ncbi:N-acylneuraminate cytidylyltransferase [Sporomusa silvacetica DSM 10669]|uniref:N-acylneuraminate cytidylyltransferase n=1 Tax=Sporomusa silvacetica DSM 10669 TaxID=1123289 RepID=A0ABZ3IQS9_9FIRM|nr:acylneuraminate cytidylyltransferase family protein [Sporomusa silvacetica]OZC20545.1 N-acylneuraminate cytidylyltransferase [Sporomusa silvacetica DSM 10669]